MVGGNGDAGGLDRDSSTTGDEANVPSSQRSIPIVDTETPGKVAISMRAAGVTVVTYLSRGEGKAGGQGEGEGEGLAQQDDMQDMVGTLTETSAREIEACAEIDTIRGKVRRHGTARSVGSCLGVARSAIQLRCALPKTFD